MTLCLVMRFLDTTSERAQSMKEQIGKLGFIKIKSFVLCKTSLRKWKDSLGENICKVYMIKDLYSNRLRTVKSLKNK